MTAKRFLRKATLKHRSHLAVMVLPNADAAFQAYRLLQYYDISPEHLAIVGQGFSSPERVGLLEPMQIAKLKAHQMAIAATILGSAIGFALLITSTLGLQNPFNLSWILIIPAVAIACGLCGALVGGILGFLGEGSTAGIYRHHLHLGRYLLMIEGPEKIVKRSREVLSYYSTLTS